MKDLIIVHPGSAHFDDFLAVSLILATHPEKTFAIERREPMDQELSNPHIWVVDIGERHEPELKNFDHHQEISLSASFVLVSDYLKLTPILNVMPWWTFKDRIDRFGPEKVGSEIGTEKLRCTYSPLESWFLEQFSENPESVKEIMRKFGRGIIVQARELSAQLEFWNNSEKVTVKGKQVMIGLTDDSYGTREYNDTLEKNPVAVTITWDKRGEGWKICRFDEFSEVDLSLLDGHEQIKFAHKTGFVAKTKTRIPVEEVLKLIEMAIRD